MPFPVGANVGVSFSTSCPTVWLLSTRASPLIQALILIRQRSITIGCFASQQSDNICACLLTKNDCFIQGDASVCNCKIRTKYTNALPNVQINQRFKTRTTCLLYLSFRIPDFPKWTNTNHRYQSRYMVRLVRSKKSPTSNLRRLPMNTPTWLGAWLRW